MSADTDADDKPPFVRCEECGSIRRTGSVHKCDTGGREIGQTRPEREELIDEDDGDPDEEVMFLRGRTDSAYHEVVLWFDLDEMLVWRDTPPRCQAEPAKREYRFKPRETVQTTGRYPCSYCFPECHNSE